MVGLTRGLAGFFLLDISTRSSMKIAGGSRPRSLKAHRDARG
jgi:hypothetical protein